MPCPSCSACPLLVWRWREIARGRVLAAASRLHRGAEPRPLFGVGALHRCRARHAALLPDAACGARCSPALFLGEPITPLRWLAMAIGHPRHAGHLPRRCRAFRCPNIPATGSRSARASCGRSPRSCLRADKGTSRHRSLHPEFHLVGRGRAPCCSLALRPWPFDLATGRRLSRAAALAHADRSSSW